MIVVLDTNILVSAILNAESSSGRILHLALNKTLPAAFNSGMYAEYGEVLLRGKFRSVREQAQIILEAIPRLWIQVATEPLAISLPDASDAPFLASAIAVQADALITGNLRHFPISARLGIKVVSPREFIEQLYSS